MANSKTLAALNEQINKEFFSAYLYLAMSADLADKGLPGFAHWMHVQAQEEMTHGMKMYNYILTRGGRVELKTIDCPGKTWKTPLDVMQASLTHEKLVTSLLNNIMDIAIKEKDHASSIFMQWFINEQVEEEEGFTNLVNKLKFIGKDGPALLVLDKELQTRVFVDMTAAPATTTGVA